MGRQDREQEGICSWQEGLRSHQGLDHRSDSCEKGLGLDRLRRSEEGDSALQEGEGAVCQVMPGGADRQIDVSLRAVRRGCGWITGVASRVALYMRQVCA